MYLEFFSSLANESSSLAALEEAAAAVAGVDTIVFTTAEYTLQNRTLLGF